MKERLKALATLVTSCEEGKLLPYIALEHVESWTGCLNRDVNLPEVPAPDAGAVAVQPGDVLFGKLRPYLAKSWLVDRRAYVSTELLCLRPRPGLDSRWLSYVFASRPLVEWAAAASDGTKMPRTSWDKLSGYRVSVPEYAQQRAIVDHLDAETARIDALIEKKQRMVKLVKERTRIQLETVATGRKQSCQRPSGHDWLGSVPEHWALVRLKYYARLESGHTPSRTRPELWENCTIPWVTLNDVGYLETHEWVDKTSNLISEEGLASSSARILPTGTVILSRDATVGRAGILAKPMATSQHFVDWICGDQLRPRFLWLLFTTVMQTHFASLTDGATLRTIGMPDVAKFAIPLPPVAEQDVIVGEAERIRTLATRTATALEGQVRCLVERRQALITAAIAGNVGVREVAA